MRILHVDTGKQWRGGQRQVLFLHQGLLREGIESYVAAYSGGFLYAKCAQNTFPLNSTAEFSLQSLRQLRHYINSLKPDIVHTHDAHSLTLALLVSYFTRPFVLINTRRVDFPAMKNILSRWKYKHSRLRKIVTISEAIKNILLNEGIQIEKLAVIHSGIEPIPIEAFSCPQEFSTIRSQAPIIYGCVASFADHKDHLTLLKAFDLVYAKEPGAYLILIGDGELKKHVEAFARQLSCVQHVIFTGFREDVYNLYTCMDVFVMTSKEEGLCTSVLDALQFGLPVIATRAGGLPEIVHHKQHGLLCEIKNPHDVAEKMLLLLKDKQLRLELGNKGKEFVKNFLVEHMVQKYITLYEELLENTISL